MRNLVDPEREMGHVDRALRRGREGRREGEREAVVSEEKVEVARTGHEKHREGEGECEECATAAREDGR